MNGRQGCSVLFVCLGNICRSPTAEGVFRAICEREGLSGQVFIDSAGTAAYHVGEPPDRRSQEAARRRGIDLSSLRARQLADEDFHRFDLLLAMDNANLSAMHDRCPEVCRDRLALFLAQAPELLQTEVPDPYYGGAQGFDEVLDLSAAAGRALLARVRELLGTE